MFSAAVVASRPGERENNGEWEFIALTQPYTDRILDRATAKSGVYFTDPVMNPARWNRLDANVANKVVAVQDALYQALGIYLTKPLHCGGATLAENSSREDHQANVLGAFNAESFGSYKVLGISQEVSLRRITHDVHTRTERTLELHNVANATEAQMKIGERGRSAVGVPWSVIKHSEQTPISIVIDPLFLSDNGSLTVKKAPEGQTISDAGLAQIMLNTGGLSIPESGRTDTVTPFDAMKFFYEALTEGKQSIRRITPVNGAKR